ncbi:MAG: hypothetical protein BM564_10960 [Bacteroidetes bacterium MedPE-SWsnd-G2]|nr:MAG: hypothetical protein BM564_10960 [Bacteroidetes bacterium MedPE-SWsnd-G2]
MKKTSVIIALALSMTATAAFASNGEITESTAIEVVDFKVKVNPFCTSIAKGDIQTVKKLIDMGADVNQKSNGMTPAMYAAKFNRVEILKLLVENGAKLDRKSDIGLTAEKYAKQTNAKDALEVIKHFTTKKNKKA